MEMATESRKKKFLKDIGIYAIGNFGSKLITFLMVPLYTYYVSDISDFGYYDVCLSAVLFLLPFVTLQLRDGAFRFLVNAEDDKERQKLVLSVVYKSLAAMLAMSMLLVAAVSLFFHVKYIWFSFGLMCAMGLLEVVSQVARGLGDTKAFVASGILASFGVGIFSILFVVVLKLGVVGIFIANILARLVAILYIELKVGIIRKYLSGGVYGDKKALFREMLKYSLPLIFVTMYWWLTNCSDRFFIAHYVGLEGNGIYSVAVRFTAILQTFGVIFYQAWQDSAYRQYNSPDRNSFFSSVFNSYIFVMAIVLLLYTFGLKVVYTWLVDDQYQASLEYIYPLGISALLYTMVQFTNIIYQCAFDTQRTVPQMVVMSIVNIVLNFSFVKWLGIYGVITASIITYLILLLYRFFDIKRYLKLELRVTTIVPVAIAAFGFIPFYYDTMVWIDILVVVVSIVVMLLALPKQYREILTSKFHRKF